MKIISKINKVVVKIEAVLIACSVIVMAVILFANTIGRFVFHHSIYCAEEIGQYCIYIITFIGLSYAVTAGKHINMLGLFDMAPQKFQKADALLIAAVTGITMGILTVISFRYVGVLKMMGKVSVTLRIPSYYIVVIIGIGFLFATLQYILILIKNLRSEEIYLGLDESYAPEYRREVKDKC